MNDMARKEIQSYLQEFNNILDDKETLIAFEKKVQEQKKLNPHVEQIEIMSLENSKEKFLYHIRQDGIEIQRTAQKLENQDFLIQIEINKNLDFDQKDFLSTLAFEIIYLKLYYKKFKKSFLESLDEKEKYSRNMRKILFFRTRLLEYKNDNTSTSKPKVRNRSSKLSFLTKGIKAHSIVEKSLGDFVDVIKNYSAQTLAIILLTFNNWQLDFSKYFKDKIEEILSKMDSLSEDKIEENTKKEFLEFLQIYYEKDCDCEFYRTLGADYCLAKVLSFLDDEKCQNVREFIREKYPTIEEKLLKLMFSFENILNYDSHSLYRILRATPYKDIIWAFRNCPENILNSVYEKLSSNHREILSKEINSKLFYKMSKVYKARKKMVKIALQLENDDEF